jgi:peptidoglycan/xylan/chitin deacetylase (PgdA/CDA1 family)
MPALAKVPPSYRFPFGTCSADNLKLLEKYHLPAVQWSIVTGDPSPDQTATAIAKGVLAAAKPGAIIIAHANGKGRHTAESLPLFIPQLRQQGFRFVTVSELLHSAKRVESAETCFEVKPGDNKRYDRLGR